MISPYYEDDAVTLYCGDSAALLPALAESGRSAGMVLTDPPYHDITHAGARTATARTPLVTFASIAVADLRSTLSSCTALCPSWVVLFCDWRHAADLESSPPAGLRYVRSGVWIKPDAAPQFTGDRPGTGWESVAVLHSIGGRMRWNGGGRHAVWTHSVCRGEHPTQKPEALCGHLIRLFSNAGDTVLDPFCGSGSVLRAAKDNGRRAIGIEIDERWCKLAARRLRQESLNLDERICK